MTEREILIAAYKLIFQGKQTESGSEVREALWDLSEEGKILGEDLYIQDVDIITSKFNHLPFFSRGKWHNVEFNN